MKPFLTLDEWNKLSSAEMKAEYKPQSDGRYFLTVDSQDGYALENVTGLRTALEKERQNVANANAALAPFKDLDAAAARAAMAELVELRKADPSAKNQAAIRALEEQLTAKFTTEKTALTTELQATESALSKALVDQVATLELSRPEVGGSPVLLMPHIRNVAKVVKLPNGERAVRVYNPDGSERISRKPGQNGPMEIGELVQEMRGDQNFAMAFKAPSATGSGATGNGAGGAGNGNFSISAADAQNPQKYQQVRTAAIAAGQTVTVVE